MKNAGGGDHGSQERRGRRPLNARSGHAFRLTFEQTEDAGMNMRHYTGRSGAVLSLLGLLIFAPAAAEAQRVEGSFQRTLNVSGGADVDVTTGSGQIDV